MGCAITSTVKGAQAHRRLGDVPDNALPLSELTRNLPEAVREDVLLFFHGQMLFTTADIASLTMEDLSQAFLNVSSEFTLGHRSAVRSLVTSAKEASLNTDEFAQTLDSEFTALTSTALSARGLLG